MVIEPIGIQMPARPDPAADDAKAVSAKKGTRK
jgi:hypothetical protein